MTSAGCLICRILILASVSVLANTKASVLIRLSEKRGGCISKSRFLPIFQSINHAIFSTPAASAPADEKPAQTLFTPTPIAPTSIPAVPQATTKIQVL